VPVLNKNFYRLNSQLLSKFPQFMPVSLSSSAPYQYFRKGCITLPTNLTMAKRRADICSYDLELGDLAYNHPESSKANTLSSLHAEAKTSEHKIRTSCETTVRSSDIEASVVNEDPPTYQAGSVTHLDRPKTVDMPRRLRSCSGVTHVSYCHYTSLVFTILCLGILLIFCTMTLLYQTAPAVVLAGLPQVLSSMYSGTIAQPQINIEQHFIIGDEERNASNTTTTTVYETVTETIITISTILNSASSTLQLSTLSAQSPSTTATAISILTTSEASSYTLMTSLQIAGTVTVTSMLSGNLSTPPSTTIVTTSEPVETVAVQPSTRYFTGPNKVGSILGGP